jgi:hypothetical protein
MRMEQPRRDTGIAIQKRQRSCATARAAGGPGPDLTFRANIKLNAQLSLRRRAKALPSAHPTSSWSGPNPEAVGRLDSARGSAIYESPRNDCRQRRAHSNEHEREPADYLGRGVASMDRDCPTALDNGAARPWKGMAAPRWKPLDLQKVH